MLMTSLRIYSGGKNYRNQASEKGGIVALLLSDWSVADKLPVNIHTPHPIPSSTHTHFAKAWWSSLSTTWRLLLLHLARYMSPIWSQVFLSWASLGIWDWFKKKILSFLTITLFFHPPTPTISTALPPNPEPATGFLGRWAALAIVRLKTNEMRRRHRGKPTKRLRSSSKKTNRYTGQLTGYCCWVGFVKFNITVSILFLQNSIFTCLTHVGATVADCTHEKCVRTTVTARHQELMQRHEVPTNSLQASWHRTVEKAGLSAFMGYYGAWLQNMWERGGQTDTTICVREPHTHTHTGTTQRPGGHSRAFVHGSFSPPHM